MIRMPKWLHRPPENERLLSVFHHMGGDQHGVIGKYYRDDLAPLIRFRKINGGSFNMGSPVRELCRQRDEALHRVELSDFWMSEAPVSNEVWSHMMLGNRDGDNRPVTRVTYAQAMLFCRMLNRFSTLPRRYEFRLPTEAEWEYACRAGTETPFYWGKESDTSLANFYCSSETFYTREPQSSRSSDVSEPGVYPANPWGLLDMHGNVSEMCLDHYSQDLTVYHPGRHVNPVVVRTGRRLIVCRGGAWDLALRYARAAHRGHCYDDQTEYRIGFRVVIGLKSKYMSIL